MFHHFTNEIQNNYEFKWNSYNVAMIWRVDVQALRLAFSTIQYNAWKNDF